MFLLEHYLFATDAWVQVVKPWGDYQAWCESNHEAFALNKVQFDGRMVAMGCTRGTRRGGKVRAWIGLRPRTPSDEQDGEVTK
jgi:hypothetical protein